MKIAFFLLRWCVLGFCVVDPCDFSDVFDSRFPLSLHVTMQYCTTPISYPESSGFLVSEAPLTKKPEDSGCKIGTTLDSHTKLGLPVMREHISNKRPYPLECVYVSGFSKENCLSVSVNQMGSDECYKFQGQIQDFKLIYGV